MKFGFWVALAMVVGVLGFGAAPAAALDLVVSPIRAEHQVEAGASETNIILIKNQGKDSGAHQGCHRGLAVGCQGRGRLIPGPERILIPAPPGCSFIPTDFKLDPGTREVRYTLTVPPGVKPGTYWTAIVLESLPATEGGKTPGRRMGVHGRIGVVIYETVGKPEIKAAFNDFQVSPAKGKLTFKLALTNTGTAFYRIKKSWVTLKNAQGQEVSRIEVPDIPVLPGSSRNLEFSKDLTLPAGEYLAEAVLDVGRSALLGSKKNFTIGR